MTRFALIGVLALLAHLPAAVRAAKEPLYAEAMEPHWKREDANAAEDGTPEFAPDALYSGGAANKSGHDGDTAFLISRSLFNFRALEERATCDPGYFPCPNLNGCCPQDRLCCSYNYCMTPGRTCCPDASCDPGWNCCGKTGCSPKGGDCCSNDNYCEPGNICVRYYPPGSDNYRIVCCTDTKCTAVITGGTTSILSTAAPPKTTPSPAITSGPLETESAQVYQSTFVWSYTVYYWITLNIRTTTVTFSLTSSTTTIRVTANDPVEASTSLVSMISSIAATPPDNAHTELASLLGVTPSPTSPTTQTTRPTNSSSNVAGPGPQPPFSGMVSLSVFALFGVLMVPGALMILL